MSDRISRSLEDIIADKSRQDQRRRGGRSAGLVARGGNQRRERAAEPYESRRSGRENDRTDRSNDEPHIYECAIKFLLNNNLSGSFIGNAGCAIRDLIEITGASIHISSPAARHPETNDRIVFISGSEDSVSLAQALVWEMLGQQTDGSNEGRALIWNPAAAKASPGEYDDVEVRGQVIIPAASAGRVLGRGGGVFRKMGADSEVQVQMSQVEESELLQERLITIEGTVGGCMRFTSMLVAKLMEEPDGCQFVYSGSAYPKHLAAGGSAPHRDSSRGHTRSPSFSADDMVLRNTGRQVSGSRPVDFKRSALEDGTGRGLETLSATTTIELAVPNYLVGAIMGVKSAKLAEINTLSGAKVRVSNKGDYVEGTTNRIVTIEGSPNCAQTAHTLVQHMIRQEMHEKGQI